MSAPTLYLVAGTFLFAAGLHGVLVRAHLIWKVLAMNVMASGVFMVLIAGSPRLDAGAADPVPQAMVLTGIVVALASTALALGMALRLAARSGAPLLREAGGGDRSRTRSADRADRDDQG